MDSLAMVHLSTESIHQHRTFQYCGDSWLQLNFVAGSLLNNELDDSLDPKTWLPGESTNTAKNRGNISPAWLLSELSSNM